MKYQTLTIPLRNPPSEWYSLKKNVKSLACIGIEYNQMYSWEVVKICINGNLNYYTKLGQMIYFPDPLFVENIRITAMQEGGSEIATASTIIFEEKND